MMLRRCRLFAAVVTLCIFCELICVTNAKAIHKEDEEVVEYEHHVGNESLTKHEEDLAHHEPPFVILFLFGCCIIGGRMLQCNDSKLDWLKI